MFLVILDNNMRYEKQIKIRALINSALPKEKKVLIVTTAVAQYLVKKQDAPGKKINPWVMAARQEALNEGSLEE